MAYCSPLGCVYRCRCCVIELVHGCEVHPPTFSQIDHANVVIRRTVGKSTFKICKSFLATKMQKGVAKFVPVLHEKVGNGLIRFRLIKHTTKMFGSSNRPDLSSSWKHFFFLKDKPTDPR